MKNHLPVLSKNNYWNPVAYTDGKRRTNPDPFVLKWCGKYYCYATDEDGVKVSESEDLILWEDRGFALCQEGYANFWAPSVIYINGIFYMYYSNEKKGTKEEHQEFLKMAVSKDPLGPFEYKKTLFEQFSIDSHPVLYGGGFYLLYSVNNILGTNSELAGTTIVMDKMLAADHPSGHPKALLEPTLDEEIFEKNRFGDGRDWYTIEGACTVFYRDKCYLLYSANAYTNMFYFVGRSWARLEKRLEEMIWHKYPAEDIYAPLICKNSEVEGTGHNTVVKAPNLVDDWIVYHGRFVSEPLVEGVEQREMRIDPLFYNGDAIVTNGPTSLIQDAPGKPTETIEEVDGKWISKGDYDYYVAQLSTHPKADKNYSGVRYRIYLNYIDEKNYIAAEIFSGENCIDILVCEGNILWCKEHILLCPEYDHFVVHQFDIQKVFDRYQIKIDNVEIAEFSHAMRCGKVGLQVSCCQLECYGFSLSRYVNLWGDSIKYLGRLLEISPQIDIENKRRCMKQNCRQYARKLAECDSFTESYTVQGQKKKNMVKLSIKYNDSSLNRVFEMSNTENAFDLYLKCVNGQLMCIVNGEVNDNVISMEHVKEIQLTLVDAELTGYFLFQGTV